MLTMTLHTVNIFTNKNVLSSLRHERIYNCHNDTFLQISKYIQTTR
jgi:hypothetical protein